MDVSVTALAIAAFVALALGQGWWRHRRAREVAARWLERHRFRVRELRMPWFGGGHFAPSPGRDSDNATDFRAVVDDLRLGGTGVVWLRVWTDWVGEAAGDVETNWERLPDSRTGAPVGGELSWADAQIALLRRVAAGETTFRPDRQASSGDAAAAAVFDEMVEHLLALGRRGLISCVTVAGRPGHAQYAAVTDVALTDAGVLEVERLDALLGPGQRRERYPSS